MDILKQSVLSYAWERSSCCSWALENHYFYNIPKVFLKCCQTICKHHYEAGWQFKGTCPAWSMVASIPLGRVTLAPCCLSLKVIYPVCLSVSLGIHLFHYNDQHWEIAGYLCRNFSATREAKATQISLSSSDFNANLIHRTETQNFTVTNIFNTLFCSS